MSETHQVENQGTPFADVDLFALNRPLREALAGMAPGLDTAGLQSLGRQAGSAEWQHQARLANAHPPALHTHDRFGHRIDQVEFHPAYHRLMGAALDHGLHATPWTGGASAHVERAAGFLLFTELEAAVLCPVSMSYAVAPALRGNPAIASAWGPGLAATAYDEHFLPFGQKTALTMGMGMTEKQGGSDVRANTTQAVFDTDSAWGRAYRLTGHKWFFSAPMSDAFLVLAQAPGGLSCFFLPRWRPDGTVNALRLQRLKHKLGNHANASSEVEFDGSTSAWLVGEEGRGVPQILAMGMLTRLDCALGSAGCMRQALSLALHHCRQRRAFGKPLIDQPLMRHVLADLALESEAATLLALRLAAAVDRSEHPSAAHDAGHDAAHEAALRRLLTPVAKFWICKRGAAFVQEAMECLGGNGYVEAGGEGVMARLYREMPLNSIWEGAGNVMALDLLRALRAHDTAAVLAQEFAAARGRHAHFDRAAERLLHDIDHGVDEAQARHLARALALLLQAAQLARCSPEPVFAAFCSSRLGDTPADTFGLLPAGTDFDLLLQRALPH